MTQITCCNWASSAQSYDGVSEESFKIESIFHHLLCWCAKHSHKFSKLCPVCFIVLLPVRIRLYFQFD